MIKMKLKELFSKIKPNNSISENDKINAAMLYYEGRYKNLAPDPLALKNFVENYGVPFYQNPYHEVDAEYYSFHPTYLVFEDFDLVASGIKERWRQNQQKINQENNALDFPDDRLSWYPEACVCWAILYGFMTDEQVELLHKEKELEDIMLVTIYAFKDGNFMDFGLESEVSKWLEKAVERTLLTSNIRNDILTERQEKHEQ